MTDEPAMIAGVLAAPDSDTPRLVYADWLDDHGQAERAAFVRAECRLARDFAGTAAGCASPIRAGHQTPAHGLRVGTVVGPCNACDVCNERAGLWAVWRESQGPKRDGEFAANYWEWFARHLTWTDYFATARGFLESLACTAADWLAHADAILAAHPVRRVRLTGIFPFYSRDLNNTWGWHDDTSLPGGLPWKVLARCSGPHGSATEAIAAAKAAFEAVWDGVTFDLPRLVTASWDSQPTDILTDLRAARERFERDTIGYPGTDFTPLFRPGL